MIGLESLRSRFPEFEDLRSISSPRGRLALVLVVVIFGMAWVIVGTLVVELDVRY